MSKLTLRSNTPSGLTNQQVDDNFLALNEGILQVAGSNLYPDFDLKDSSFYTGDSGATFSIIPNVLTTGNGRINYLRSDTTTKNVYTGWFKVEPNKDYTFSSTCRVGQPNAATVKVSVQFATVTDYTTNNFAVSTQDEIGNSTLATDVSLEKQIKSGVADRRARFVIEHLNQTLSTSVFAGEFKCITPVDVTTLNTSFILNNLIPNSDFGTGSFTNWDYSNAVVQSKTSLASISDSTNIANTSTSAYIVKFPLNVISDITTHGNITDINKTGVVVSSGDKFNFEYYRAIGADNVSSVKIGTVTIYVYVIKSDGSVDGTILYNTGILTDTQGSWIKFNHEVTSNFDGRMYLKIRCTNPDHNIYIARPNLVKKTNTTTLVDGSVTFPKLNSTALTALTSDLKPAGVPSLGTSTTIPRSDHVHPRDNSVGGFKNQIINGTFDYWERGFSQNQTGGGGYGSADRWHIRLLGGTPTYTLERALTAALPTQDINTKYCAKITVSGVPSGAGNYFKVSQTIENIRRFYDRHVVVTFWMKSSVANKKTRVSLGASSSSSGSDFYWTTDLAGNNQYLDVTLTTTWQKFEIPFYCQNGAVGTRDAGITYRENICQVLSPEQDNFYAHNSGLRLDFEFANGTTGDPLLSQSGTFFLAQVQLEYGLKATDFEFRRPDVEEKLCRRYYERHFASLNGITSSSNFALVNYKFVEGKRTIPTVQIDKNGSFMYSSGSGTAQIASIGARHVDKFGINEINISNTGGGNSPWLAFTTDPTIVIKADAELY